VWRYVPQLTRSSTRAGSVCLFIREHGRRRWAWKDRVQGGLAPAHCAAALPSSLAATLLSTIHALRFGSPAAGACPSVSSHEQELAARKDGGSASEIACV